MIALDASALVAFLFREAGHEKVAAVLDEAWMSTVNLAEVLSLFSRDGHDPDAALNRLLASPIRFVTFDTDAAAEAASLAPRAKPLGLSLGDRACLALARRHYVAAMTADRAWAEHDWGVPVECIR